ncbi:mitochondrial fission ELM1 family protein [Komagataeibacter sp. FNDCF1]|uniref:mitochondrial fission ELM1 family protein n=1 Tax=Komagataeibacter sp. FNDCF1 TaxID=2878681 RepID=UPI001E2CA274|nr:mitochondrial fission ELM1 family protein [Komagataeibacter sp. FNDCF1]MCE2563887.1 mitochondrial fission ELM1 family protein [Komagataeibacter sp. FNDCF1]
MTTSPRPASVIAADLAGMRSQTFGLARRAGLEPQLHALAPRGLWRHVPTAWWPMPLRAVQPLGLGADYLEHPVISIGGSGGAVGAALRRKGACVIQVQNPRLPPSRFDLVIANRHDRITGPNVILTRTALHGVTPDLLARARVEWASRLSRLPRPLVAVLVGGGNGRFRLGRTEGAVLGGQLATMMRREHVGIALTPSRRTAPEVCRELHHALAGPDAWIWEQSGSNPYLGLLACADAIVVTMDSVSMISEAVATSAPVMVAALPGRSRRIGQFLHELTQAGRIRPFAGRLEIWPVTPLDDTIMAAEAVRHHLGLAAVS